MDANPISKRRRGSEEEYFRQIDAERLEGLRQAGDRRAEAERIAAALGLPDALRAEALRALGIRAETVPAFMVLPLVEVAWADGGVDEEERWRVLEAATRQGVELGRPAHALLERWLEARPDEALFRAWHELATEGLLASGASEVRQVAEAAASVASAAGGVLGFARVSRDERRTLASIEQSLTGLASAPPESLV